MLSHSDEVTSCRIQIEYNGCFLVLFVYTSITTWIHWDSQVTTMTYIHKRSRSVVTVIFASKRQRITVSNFNFPTEDIVHVKLNLVLKMFLFRMHDGMLAVFVCVTRRYG